MAMTFDTFKALASFVGYKIKPSILVAKGSTDNETYVCELDPVTGAIKTSATVGAKDVVEYFSNDFSSTSITDSAFTTLHTLANDAGEIFIYNDTGEPMEVAKNGTGKFLLPPGGIAIEAAYLTGDTMGFKSLGSATINSGNIYVNFLV